jgi:hypothetical protein
MGMTRRAQFDSNELFPMRPPGSQSCAFLDFESVGRNVWNNRAFHHGDTKLRNRAFRANEYPEYGLFAVACDVCSENEGSS